MNLWRSMTGQVVAELTSADVPGALIAANESGINIHRAQFVEELTVQLTVDRRDYSSLKMLADKRGEKLRVLKRMGLYWAAVAAFKRPVLMVGLAFLLLAAMILPTRVLFVRVEGNENIPSRLILAAAEDCGIRFGASRREVRSEKVKNALLGQVPQLQWAGVNTAGCVATISVRERTRTETREPSQEVSSIVASRDGVILSCTITAGSGQCVPGQAVKEGQVLISGYTDCGLTIKATRAEGEIMARTRREITAVTPSEALRRGDSPSESKNYSLILGKKRINLANSSGICDATCGRMYKEYYITLPGGFQLPVALAVERHICYDTETFERAVEEVESALISFSRDYTQAQMVSGTIMDSEAFFAGGKGICKLEADYLCVEMIGRRRQEN